MDLTCHLPEAVSAAPVSNGLVAKPSDVNVFASPEWFGVLHTAYGFAPVDSDRYSPEAMRRLPLVEVSSRLTGRRGVCLPFADECSPRCDSADEFDAVWTQALDVGERRSWQYVEVRGDADGFSPAEAAVTYWGHRLPLSSSDAEQLERCCPSTRRAIAKAARAGMKIEFSTDLAALRAFYSLLCRTRRRQGALPQPWRFFAAIHRHLMAAGKGCVALARMNDVPIAGALFLYGDRTVLYKFAASDVAFQTHRANNLVLWTAIRRFAADGFSVLDFGRTSVPNTGLRRFKLGWGATERAIRYYRFDLRSNTFVRTRDLAHGWHTTLFRLLPTGLGRLAGELLYRHIA